MQGERTDAPFWQMARVESATLAVAHVLDAARCDVAQALADIEGREPRQEEVLQRYGSVLFIYLIITDGGDAPFLGPAPAEPYDGQLFYRVYWQLDLATRRFTCPDGQPAELFGLRALAEKTITDGIAAKIKPIYAIKPKYPAVLPWVLVGINAAVLALMYLDGYGQDDAIALRFGAIIPERVFENGEYYRLFTAMFVHFGLQHLFMNAVALLVFGTRIERYLGPLYFTLIYLVSGLCGSAASLFFTQGYSAGASGAIYGLVGATLAFTRITRQPMDQVTDYVMIIYILVGMAAGFATAHIDNYGHIGGLLAGVALGALATRLKRGR